MLVALVKMINNPIKIIFMDKVYWGFNKCPDWLKKKYKEAVNYTCEDCKLKESMENILEIHRPKRGIDGGLYTVVPKGHPLCNWKVLCKKCHDIYDYGKKFGSY